VDAQRSVPPARNVLGKDEGLRRQKTDSAATGRVDRKVQWPRKNCSDSHVSDGKVGTKILATAAQLNGLSIGRRESIADLP
jgi:hypothetical protein